MTETYVPDFVESRATNCTYYTRMVLPAYLRDKDFAADIKVSLLTKQRSIAIGRNLVVAGILRPLISNLTPQSQPDAFKAGESID